MVRRALEPALRAALKRFPVVALIGPRQVGKTTLARSVAEAAPEKTVHLDLELPSDLARLADPEMYLGAQSGRLVVIDEVQRRPDLFPLMRALVDKDRRSGRFLLLGSADLTALKGISESLAGRIRYLELSPLTRMEVGKRVAISRHWLLGGYPDALLTRVPDASWEWLEALIRSYTERDLPQLGFRVAAPEFRRFWTMLAHNHGQPWNAQQLASSFGVTPPTASHYRSILEQMLLVRALRPWHSNIGKRLVKAPRVYVRDSGLLHALMGIRSPDGLAAHPLSGKSWEGFVLEQIAGAAPDVEASFYRTHAGAEMDLVLSRGTKVLAAVEVKLGLSPVLSRGFYEARKDLGGSPGWVIYSGNERYEMSPGVEALGLDEFLADVLPRVARA